MELSPKEIKSGLKRKGWAEEERAHHTYFFFCIEGKKTKIRTYLSRSPKKSYGAKLLSNIKKQLYLNSNEEVVEYIRCKLKNEEYIRILKEKKVL